MLARASNDKEKKRTMNLGLRNSLWSSRFSFVFLPFLFAAVVPNPGRLIPAPFVTGAKSSLVSSLRSLSQGQRKALKNDSDRFLFGTSLRSLGSSCLPIGCTNEFEELWF